MFWSIRSCCDAAQWRDIGNCGSAERRWNAPSSPRYGKPPGILISFESEEDWFEYHVENDPRFLRRIEHVRKNLQAGHGTRLEGH